LKPGEKVITQGVDRLRDGSKVEVIDPNAKPPAEDDSAKGKSPHGDKKGKGPPMT
jgi:hypothetical protein